MMTEKRKNKIIDNMKAYTRKYCLGNLKQSCESCAMNGLEYGCMYGKIVDWLEGYSDPFHDIDFEEALK